MNPGSPAWGAGVLVQARRPPLPLFRNYGLGFKIFEALQGFLVAGMYIGVLLPPL